MNEELQRIKIAEACGWKRVTDGHYESWVSPEGYEYQVMFGWQTYKDGTDILPDYLNDLNAMHEAEKILSLNQQNAYINILNEMPDYKCPVHHDFQWCCSTAAQRAEAFLRTLNLWEE
jgi:hypothetical protein